MVLFRRYRPNDVLYLMPVRLTGEKLPKGKIRMLSCDATGKVYDSLIDRSVYELARRHVQKLEQAGKNFATLGLEVSPGEFVPWTVEVSGGEVWALEHILEHALKRGSLPDVLKKYLRQVIKMGEGKRKELAAKRETRKRQVPVEATPRVLDRLSYYSENNIEVSIPIYKAEHSYPLIVLKRLLPSEQTPPDVQRLLVLDSDGDLAISRVPVKLIDEAQKGLEEWQRKKGENVCIICSRHPEGFSMSYIVISEQQRKALEAITQYFEESGQGRQPISTIAREVLARARDTVSSLY